MKSSPCFKFVPLLNSRMTNIVALSLFVHFGQMSSNLLLLIWHIIHFMSNFHYASLKIYWKLVKKKREKLRHFWISGNRCETSCRWMSPRSIKCVLKTPYLIVICDVIWGGSQSKNGTPASLMWISYIPWNVNMNWGKSTMFG